jgi:hypothetical protein
MRAVMMGVLVWVCVACACAGQEPANADRTADKIADKISEKAKEPTGGVTGHVLCGDTNLPARLASVLIQPAYEAVPVKPKPKPGEEMKDEDQPQTPTVSIAQTLLDGSYTINGVKPGKYYVIVEKEGYLSPLSQLTREQLNKPDDAAQALINKLLAPVTVAAAHVATADVRIVRGGAISGTVRFDDGSPDGDGNLSLLRKSAEGKWEDFHPSKLAGMFHSESSDDQGHYRISGLPVGEYLVKAEIRLMDMKMDNLFGDNHSIYFNSGYTLSVYSGGALRTRDAKAIKLQEGEEADMADIEIPVSKLHAVSGSVLDPSGHAVNAAKVSIVYPDDDTELVSANVSKDDDQFHFYFVPEGEYTLKVTSAKDVTREEIPYPPGSMPPTHTVEKTVREYQDTQQALVIAGELTGVVATVAAKDVKLAAQ